MQEYLKKIKIGRLIKKRVKECEIEMPRICKFLKCEEEDVIKMYENESVEVDLLLLWCKLLEYDFFRLYSQHLILYAPPSSTLAHKNKTDLPVFRKNIYTKEIIEFILDLIGSGKKTKNEVMAEYNIPKTTLYKWINKYANTSLNEKKE